MNQVCLQDRPPTPFSSLTYHWDVGETTNLKKGEQDAVGISSEWVHTELQIIFWS